MAARSADLSAVARGESAKADVAQSAERVLKDEVTSSILVIGSIFGWQATKQETGHRWMWRRWKQENDGKTTREREA